MVLERFQLKTEALHCFGQGRDIMAAVYLGPAAYIMNQDTGETDHPTIPSKDILSKSERYPTRLLILKVQGTSKNSTALGYKNLCYKSI